MIDFLLDNLLLLPFLFITYLILEILEARMSGALEQKLGRVRHWGPLFGAIAGAVPQCGFSAAAASFFAGGAITVGTLIAVFLSTSDELIPVLLAAKGIPVSLMVKIVAFKTLGGVVAGFAVNIGMKFFHRSQPQLHIDDLCEHSHCGCVKRSGVIVPAVIHTLEIFAFILLVSGAFELLFYFLGEDWLGEFVLQTPVIGEMVAAFFGFIPNCAVSVVGAELYAKGVMSSGALMASSFAGSGAGLLVLLRTNRNLRQNLLIIAGVYFFGVVFGYIAGLIL